MKSTELIMQDHTILRRGMDILDGMGKKLEDGERIEVADVTTLLRFFRVFGEYHQNMEEKVFFPVLLCAVSEQIPVHVLLSEHVQELMITAEIEEALKSKRGMSFFQATRRLSSLLRNHFDQEDAIFPDLTRRWLSRSRIPRLRTDWRKFTNSLKSRPISHVSNANTSRDAIELQCQAKGLRGGTQSAPASQRFRSRGKMRRRA